jgi:hypothetical protein
MDRDALQFPTQVVKGKKNCRSTERRLLPAQAETQVMKQAEKILTERP